ncbi:hypothetical protein EKK58_09970 [Candidatus Dependentiae bacterium]|nr:MAG: hypothetical protein EKK58_09970 [Candidatus Dependentiae bacterium]
MSLKKPLCPYCRKELSDANIVDLYASQGCDTCGYGQEITGKIEIHCDNCEKLIYVKEFTDRPNG